MRDRSARESEGAVELLVGVRDRGGFGEALAEEGLARFHLGGVHEDQVGEVLNGPRTAGQLGDVAPAEGSAQVAEEDQQSGFSGQQHVEAAGAQPAPLQVDFQGGGGDRFRVTHGSRGYAQRRR